MFKATSNSPMHVCENLYKPGIGCKHAYCSDCFKELMRTTEDMPKVGRSRRQVNYKEKVPGN